jgi:hypothetical protein
VGNAAYNGVKQVYNATQNAGQNIYNAATGNTQQKPQTQAPSTQPSPAAQQQNTQPAQAQPEVDWAAEYDKAMAPQTTPTTSAQPGGQAAQPPTSAAAQSALGEGAGQWQAELDNVMAQIMGKGKFDYNMNGDAMYQQYADIYQNQANLGMQNAMAQAAALTGGYGSSYGQMVGQQAYAQQMQGLNDIGLELYDRAYAQDMAERSQLMDQYNMLAAREQQAYNRGIDERNFEYQQGRDEVADNQWQQSFDYNKYLDELNQSNFDKQFEYQQSRDNVSDSQWKAELDRMLANDEISQQQWQAEMDRALANDATANEQWQAGMDWQAEEFDKLYGKEGYYTKQNAIDNQYRQEAFDYQKEQDKQAQTNYEKEFEYQQGRDKVADDQWNKQFTEQQTQNAADNKYRNDALAQDQKQFDASMNWQREEYDRMYGYTDEKGNKVSGYYEDMADKEFNQMYGPEGYMTKKDKQDQENWQKQYDREDKWYADAQEAAKSTTKYEGEGDFNGQEVPKQLAGVQNLTTTNTNLFDETGRLKSVAIVKTTPTGDGMDSSKDVVTYNIGGKEVELRRGYSPYTNNKNPDANNGTFNGYQPNNVASYYDGDKEAGKLSNAGFGTIINGQIVPVYTDGKGVEWVYDAANNKYEKYEYEEKKEPTTLGTGKEPTTLGTGKGKGRPSGVYAPTQALK